MDGSNVRVLSVGKGCLPFLALAGFLAAGCGTETDQTAAREKTRTGDTQAEAVSLGEPISAHGLSFRVPGLWTRRESTSPMRAAEFVLPAEGSAEPGELVFYFFGVGEGGDAQANIERWIGQFEAAGGGGAKPASSTDEMTVSRLTITTVVVDGTMLPSRMPGMTATDKKPGWRMLGAVVEGAGGPWFFKATGPASVIGAAEKGFNAMLASMAPATT